ncbi:MAG: ribosome silencing factor [Chitinophagaceae bacterium]
MKNSTTTTTRKKSSIVRLTRNSKIFKNIILAIQEKKAQHIVSLDLRKIPEAVADFFIICEATNSTQLNAIANFIEEDVRKKSGEMPYKHEGKHAQQWILIDYISIVVHVMMPEQRKFYQLEELWSDAIVMEHIDD